MKLVVISVVPTRMHFLGKKIKFIRTKKRFFQKFKTSSGRKSEDLLPAKGSGNGNVSEAYVVALGQRWTELTQPG